MYPKFFRIYSFNGARWGVALVLSILANMMLRESHLMGLASLMQDGPTVVVGLEVFLPSGVLLWSPLSLVLKSKDSAYIRLRLASSFDDDYAGTGKTKLNMAGWLSFQFDNSYLSQ